MLRVSIKILHRESKEVFREAKGIIKGMKIALEVKKKLEDRRKDSIPLNRPERRKKTG